MFTLSYLVKQREYLVRCSHTIQYSIFFAANPNNLLLDYRFSIDMKLVTLPHSCEPVFSAVGKYFLFAPRNLRSVKVDGRTEVGVRKKIETL